MKTMMNTISILEKRKSIRSFNGEQLDEEELETLLQAANGSPIAENRTKDIQIYVIQDKDLLMQVEETTQLFFSKINYKIKGIYDTPTLILIAVRKLQEPYSKALFCSAACMTENMIFASTEMNLGNVFLTGVTSALNYIPHLLPIIGVPNDFEVATALAVGHTNCPFIPRNLTKPHFQITRL